MDCEGSANDRIVIATWEDGQQADLLPGPRESLIAVMMRGHFVLDRGLQARQPCLDLKALGDKEYKGIRMSGSLRDLVKCFLR
jgi:hypothetical protein